MILEHNGITLDFFERFPRSFKSIGVQLSGGLDSALILYLLVKMAQDRKDGVYIYPVTGYDVSKPSIKPYETVEKIIQWITNKTNYDLIQPLTVVPYISPDGTKIEMTRVSRKYLNERYGCKAVLDGISLGGPSARETDIWNNNDRIKELYTKHPYEFPWAIVDKKFIAAQYKKFDIEELSMLTNSCIFSSTSPCKECWWCRERYWAFGSYDGGIK